MRETLTALFCASAVTMSGSALAEGTDLAKMNDAERAAFGQEVRAYLLQNPEVIFEAIQILEQRRAVAARHADRDLIVANADALFNDGYSFVMGNPNGDVTLVEFLDYRCGYCKRAHPVMQELIDRDPNLRVIVKDFPILGPESVEAGKMALAAVELDPAMFKTLNDRMMNHPGNITEQIAYRIAGDVGYDLAGLRALAESSDIDDRLQRNYQLAQRLGLRGTPAFVVGNEIIRGFLPTEEMHAAIEQARTARN